MNFFSEAVQALSSLAFPNMCRGCYNELLGKEELVCLHCWNTIPRTKFQHYAMNDVARKLYGRIYFNRACAAYYFSKVSSIQELLHHVKYRNDVALGLELGRRMALELEESKWLQHMDCIIPIPLSERKKKERGYNQSELLARGISEVCGIAVETNSVIRKRNTSTQTKMNVTQRLENMKDAFELNLKTTLEGKHVLLLDDVLTTGATIESCAREILKVPGTEISILTLAYAIDY